MLSLNIARLLSSHNYQVTLDMKTWNLLLQLFDNVAVKEEVEVKEEKIVKSVKKGSAVMDKCLPDHIKAQYHVLQVVRHLRVFFIKQRKRQK